MGPVLSSTFFRSANFRWLDKGKKWLKFSVIILDLVLASIKHVKIFTKIRCVISPKEIITNTFTLQPITVVCSFDPYHYLQRNLTIKTKLTIRNYI